MISWFYKTDDPLWNSDRFPTLVTTKQSDDVTPIFSNTVDSCYLELQGTL